MKRTAFIGAVIAALLLSGTGAAALVEFVMAADGVKSSIVTFVLALGYALLGPALLSAVIFFQRESDGRLRKKNYAREAPGLRAHDGRGPSRATHPPYFSG